MVFNSFNSKLSNLAENVELKKFVERLKQIPPESSADHNHSGGSIGKRHFMDLE